MQKLLHQRSGADEFVQSALRKTLQGRLSHDVQDSRNPKPARPISCTDLPGHYLSGSNNLRRFGRLASKSGRRQSNVLFIPTYMFLERLLLCFSRTNANTTIGRWLLEYSQRLLKCRQFSLQPWEKISILVLKNRTAFWSKHMSTWYCLILLNVINQLTKIIKCY